MSARDEDIDVPPLRKFHRNIYGVGHNSDVVIHRQPANYLGRGGSRSERNGLAWTDQSRSNSTNATFLLCGALHLRHEGTVLTEGFIEQGFHGDRAAMSAPQQTLLL